MKRIPLLRAALIFAATLTVVPYAAVQQRDKKYGGMDFILETGGFTVIYRFPTTGCSLSLSWQDIGSMSVGFWGRERNS